MYVIQVCVMQFTTITVSTCNTVMHLNTVTRPSFSVELMISRVFMDMAPIHRLWLL